MKYIILMLIMLTFVSALDTVNFGSSLGSNYDQDYLAYSGEDANDVTVQDQDGFKVVEIPTKGDLKVGDYQFSNVIAIDDETPASFALNNKGEIAKANFKVSNIGSEYTLGDTKFFAPPNSNVSYDGTKIVLQLADGEELKELPTKNGDSSVPVDILGNGIKLPNGVSLDDGSLYYKDGKYYTNDAVLNGVNVKGEGVQLFFDGLKHDLDKSYVSIGVDKVFANMAKTGKDIKLNFDETSFMKGKVNFDLLNKGDYSLDLKKGEVNLDVRDGGLEKIVGIQNGGSLVDIYGNGSTLSKKIGEDITCDFIMRGNVLNDKVISFKNKELQYGETVTEGDDSNTVRKNIVVSDDQNVHGGSYVPYNSDYEFIPSPNRNSGKNKPDMIVIHYTGGHKLENTVDFFKTEVAQVSANYVVGKDGRIVQMALDEDIAWHAGCSKRPVCKIPGINSHSVGIEVVNLGYNCRKTFSCKNANPFVYPDDCLSGYCTTIKYHSKYWERYPDVQIDNLARLVADIAKRNNIFPSRSTIIGHEEVYGNKVDPGPAFPWDDFMEKVYGYYIPN